MAVFKYIRPNSFKPYFRCWVYLHQTLERIIPAKIHFRSKIRVTNERSEADIYIAFILGCSGTDDVVDDCILDIGKDLA